VVTDKRSISHEPIRFRVVAIERFALPDPINQDHTMLSVHYLNPAHALRGASFDLSPAAYAAYRDALGEALESGATYWVIWDAPVPSGIPHQRGQTAVDRLLRAIGDKQIVSDEPNHG
jgi:hypothetical protein